MYIFEDTKYFSIIFYQLNSNTFSCTLFFQDFIHKTLFLFFLLLENHIFFQFFRFLRLIFILHTQDYNHFFYQFRYIYFLLFMFLVAHFQTSDLEVDVLKNSFHDLFDLLNIIYFENKPNLPYFYRCMIVNKESTFMNKYKFYSYKI